MAARRLMLTGRIAILCLTGYALADDGVLRCEDTVEQWFRMCHLRATDTADPDMTQPFEELVMKDGRDETWFVSSMQEEYFPMTTFGLFDHEKADVVALSSRDGSRVANHSAGSGFRVP